MSQVSSSWATRVQDLLAREQFLEAESILRSARQLKPADPQMWRLLASLRGAQGNYADQIEALESLERLGLATAHDLNLLGIAYWREHLYSQAELAYKRALAKRETKEVRHNLGLLYNHDEVSQDLDAIDCYLLALRIDPEYQPAKTGLERTAKKLLPLAAKVKATGTIVLDSSLWYQHFIDPFRLFGLDPSECIREGLDAAAVTRSRKKVLAEIQLADNVVEWFDADAHIDASLIHRLDGDLRDPKRAKLLAIVSLDDHLVAFLSKGDTSHFLYDGSNHSLRTRQYDVDSNDEISELIGSAFAKQYDQVLGRAIASQRLALIEVLFDGRRYLRPELVEIAFNSALRWGRDVLADIKKLKDQSEERLVSSDEVRHTLESRSVVGIYNLLPAYFRDLQYSLVSQVREIAVNNYNKHTNSGEAQKVLDVCRSFIFKSGTLNKQIEDDNSALQNIIQGERRQTERQKRYAYHDTLRKGIDFEISYEGVRLGGSLLPADEIDGIRLGIYIHRTNGVEDQREYTVQFLRRGKVLNLSFTKAGIFGFASRMIASDGDVIPIENRSKAEQDAAYQRMMESINEFIAHRICENVISTIQSGGESSMGSVKLTRKGVSFETGLFRRKSHVISWRDVTTDTFQGQLTIQSAVDKKASTSLTIRETTNALLFPIISKIMKRA